jgi:hypothetical protein
VRLRTGVNIFELESELGCPTKWLDVAAQRLCDISTERADLTPIEGLWAILKRRIEELEPRNLRDLIELAFDAWNSITEEELVHLKRSIGRRLRAVVHQNGDCIHWPRRGLVHIGFTLCSKE